jgi:hypothetical protein
MTSINETNVFEQSQAAQSLTTLTTLTTITTNNNLTTFNVLTPNGVDDEQEQESYGHLLASPEGLGEVIPSTEKTVGHSELSPAKWKYAKVDLFDNTTEKQLKKGVRKLRLSLSFLTHTSPNYKYLGALMNSRVRDTKRGFDFDDVYEKSHYDLLIQTYTELKEMGYNNVRLSKCYERAVKGKGKTIFGLSVVLAEQAQAGEYIALIIDGTDITPISLSGRGLSDKQRAGNCISSGQTGTQSIKRKTRNDFFKD